MIHHRDDIVEEFAVKILVAAYFRAQCDDKSQAELDDLREAIEIAKGWRSA